MSIQKNPDKRDLRYLKLITGRLEGRSDEDIAEGLGFDSSLTLYQQIRENGHSICTMCGTTYVEEGHCKQAKKTRRGSGKGEPVELPPTKEAAPLFKEALDKLLEVLEVVQGDYESASSRRYSKEYLQGELFFQYIREEILWADGLDRTGYTPAQRSPGNGLTRLIAVYLLAFNDLGPLIEKLCPDITKLDREKLRKQLEGEPSKPGFFDRAENVAILIRGGDHIRTGPPPGEFSVDEQIIRRRTLEGRREGYSDQQIIEMLSEEGISTSQAEIRRLGRTNLPDPSL